MEINYKVMPSLGCVWRLNNLLLNSPGIEQQLNKEMSFLYGTPVPHRKQLSGTLANCICVAG